MTRPPKLIHGSIGIDLREIQEGTHPLVLEGGKASLAVEPEGPSALRRYRFEGSLQRTGEDCRVRGFLSGFLETRCDRCLSTFRREILASVDAQVALAPSQAGGAPADPNGSAAGTSGTIETSEPGAATLDLTASFRQAALLEIPIKNLCRDDCRGICSVCGVNLNDGPCPHREDSRDRHSPEGDSRWDALRRLSFPSESEE
jgi:uncharacterized protein